MQITVAQWFPSIDMEKTDSPKQIMGGIFQEVSLSLDQRRVDITSESSVFAMKEDE